MLTTKTHRYTEHPENPCFPIYTLFSRSKINNSITLQVFIVFNNIFGQTVGIRQFGSGSTCTVVSESACRADFPLPTPWVPKRKLNLIIILRYFEETYINFQRLSLCGGENNIDTTF